MRKHFITKGMVLALAAIMIMPLMLTGCARNVSHGIDEYFLEIEYKEDFRILQLSDIHLANKDDRQRQYDFMALTINDADADMIVVTGDIFTFADKVTACEFFDFLDSFGIWWTVVFGNHDEQCYFSIDWMTDKLNNYGSNCVFIDHQDDDVFGNCNFAVNLMKDDKVHTQLIFIDSNRYNFGEYTGYDYIKDDQIEWYGKIVDETTALNGGVVPSLMFYHIPVPEFEDAWESVQTGEGVLEEGRKGENVAKPKINSGFFDVIEEKGSTKAMFVGHDHVNNFRVLYKDIYFCYGVTSTDRIYYEEDLMGGQVVTIHDDNSLDFEQIFHTYEEVAK